MPGHLGSPLVTYTIEMREPSQQWRELATGVNGHHFSVNHLDPEKDYMFRVIPVNEYGPGEPSVPVPTYLYRKRAPFDYRPSPDFYRDRRAEDYDKSRRWSLPYALSPWFTEEPSPAPPAPSRSHTRARSPSPSSLPSALIGLSSALIGSSPRATSVPPETLYSFDTSDINDYGAPPEFLPHKPTICDYHGDSFKLSWSPAQTSDKGIPSAITYIVECREPHHTDWRQLATNLTDFCYTVRGLDKNKDYILRVRPENEFGIGEPTLPVSTYLFRKPDKEDYGLYYKPRKAPVFFIDKPRVSRYDGRRAELSWSPPSTLPIYRPPKRYSYVVEFADPSLNDWKPLTRGLHDNRYVIRDLRPDKEYLYRIIAETERGVSEPTSPVAIKGAARRASLPAHMRDEYSPRSRSYSPTTAGRSPLTKITERDLPPLPRSHSLDARPTQTSTERPYAPSGRSYSGTERSYSPVGRSYTPVDRSYSPAGRSYSPTGRSYSPIRSTYSPAVRSYSPTGRTKDYERSYTPSPLASGRRASLPSVSPLPTIKKTDKYSTHHYTPPTKPPLTTERPFSAKTWLLLDKYTKPLPPSSTRSREYTPSSSRHRRRASEPAVRHPVSTTTTYIRDYSPSTYTPHTGPSTFRVKKYTDFSPTPPPSSRKTKSRSRDYTPTEVGDASIKPRKQRERSLDSPRRSQTPQTVEKPCIPYFTVDNPTQYAAETKAAKIIVYVHAYPPPKIRWYKGEEKLPLGERFNSYLAPNGLCTLEFNRMTPKDVGDYKIWAQNDLGQDCTTIRLELADPPTFLEPIKDIFIPVRTSGRLECRVDGIPYPDVKWMKDWRALPGSYRVSIQQEGPDKWTLNINNAIDKDGGLYTCVAENLAGKVFCSANVHVEDLPEPVEIEFKPLYLEDHYHILEELGRGSCGIVRRVIERCTGHEYAAKYLQVRDEDDKQDLRPILDTWKKANHRLIAKLVDAYETPKRLVMVSDLATGGELFDKVVHEDNLNEARAAFYIQQLLEALQHLQDNNVLHLDIKPENILLSRHGLNDIKLIDFGNSRIYDPKKKLLVKYGNPEFVAPEVVRGDPVGQGTDLWGVGVVAYVLLSGVSPFLGKTNRETLEKVKEGAWTFDPEGFAVVSEKAKQFIGDLLNPDESKRPTLSQCLKHPWIKLADVDAPGTRLPTEKLREFVSRRKWQRTLGAVKFTVKLKTIEDLLAEPDEEMPAPPGDDFSSGEEDAWYEWYTRYQGDDTKLLPTVDSMPVRLREYRREQGEKSDIDLPIPEGKESDPELVRKKTMKARQHLADVEEEDAARRALAGAAAKVDDQISQMKAKKREQQLRMVEEGKTRQGFGHDDVDLHADCDVSMVPADALTNTVERNNLQLSPAAPLEKCMICTQPHLNSTLVSPQTLPAMSACNSSRDKCSPRMRVDPLSIASTNFFSLESKAYTETAECTHVMFYTEGTERLCEAPPPSDKSNNNNVAEGDGNKEPELPEFQCVVDNENDNTTAATVRQRKKGVASMQTPKSDTDLAKFRLPKMISVVDTVMDKMKAPSTDARAVNNNNNSPQGSAEEKGPNLLQLPTNGFQPELHQSSSCPTLQEGDVTSGGVRRVRRKSGTFRKYSTPNPELFSEDSEELLDKHLDCLLETNPIHHAQLSIPVHEKVKQDYYYTLIFIVSLLFGVGFGCLCIFVYKHYLKS